MNQQTEAGVLGGKESGGHNKDKRGNRKTGKYSTREELILAAKDYHRIGLTHKEVGLKIGVDASTVHRLLTGDKMTSNTKPKTISDRPKLMTMFNSLWKAQ